MRQNRILLSARFSSALATLILPFFTNCSAGEGPADVGESAGTAVEADPLVNGFNSSLGSVGVITCSSCTSAQFNCSASLIGRRTALTAAHCVKEGQSVKFCTSKCGNVSGCTNTCVAGTAKRFPGYSGDGDFDHDLAIVRLNQDFAALTGTVPEMVGGPMSEGDYPFLVGYGCTDRDNPNAGVGQQRIGQNKIEDIYSQTIEYDDDSRAYSCPGDSGGPAMLSNCVIGVTDGMTEIPIFDTDYVLSRVDTKLSWIQSTASDASVRECAHPLCGDGLCQTPEACNSCPSDCGTCPPPPPPPKCGDGTCNGTESHQSCPGDCEFGDCPTGKVDCCDTGQCLTATVCKKLGCL